MQYTHSVALNKSAILKSKSFLIYCFALLSLSQHHSYRSFLGITCLMQISTREEDFIIDTLELRSEMYVLNESFTNPSIVKVSFCQFAANLLVGRDQLALLQRCVINRLFLTILT